MKIDREKLRQRTGLSFESPTDIYYYIENHLDYLSGHNKNYTKEQCSRIDDLRVICECIDIWNEED